MITFLSGYIERIDMRETMRYLGYAGVKSADGMDSLFFECEKMILPELAPRAVYDVYDISREGEGDGEVLKLGFSTVKSKCLSKSLTGCGKAALFAATVGAGVDRLIVKYGKLSPSRAVVIQAMGAAAVEQWCDEIEDTIKKNFGKCRPRFSCGYGDLPLALQREIFPALAVTKNLGITLTDGDLMIPSKSVTAIVGISGNDE